LVRWLHPSGEYAKPTQPSASIEKNGDDTGSTAVFRIKALIEESVATVRTGSTQVDSAGQTMEQIVQSIQRVADMIGEVTAAANEQSDSIAQVNAALGQLDQTTQQNATLVEEAAAAAQSLRQQAAELQQVVSQFRTGVGDGPPMLIAAK
jgi:methyl-accepting chemotaxis protein